MAFTDFLLRRGNPTNNWVRNLPRGLTIDLGRALINGVGFGESIKALHDLGRDEDSSKARGFEFCYYSLGLEIDAWDDTTIYSLSIVVNEAPFQPFTGTVLFRDLPIDLRRLSEGTLESTFGPWYWRDQDADETIIFYELRACEWNFELTPQGALKRIVIESEPVLAKAEQRAAYRVTKPWPPEYLELD